MTTKSVFQDLKQLAGEGSRFSKLWAKERKRILRGWEMVNAADEELHHL